MRRAGRTCSLCGETKPLSSFREYAKRRKTDGRCVDCMRPREREAARARPREAIAAISAAYRARYPKRNAEACRRWRESHPGSNAESCRRWREKRRNREVA